MIRALYSAASGMTAQQMNVDNIAHNLANANTAGFKTRRAQFQDLLYQNVVQPGAAAGSQIDRAHRPAARPGNARRVERNRLHAGRLLADRQSARPGDSGPGLLPDPAAERRPGVYARRQVPAEQRRQHRDLQRRSAGAADHHSAGRAIDHHRHRRHRQLSPSPARPRRRWPDRSSSRTFANPAGLNSIGQNLYTPTDASGDAIVGQSRRPGRSGHAAAGLHRAIQRQRGGRVRQPDRQPARL